MSTINLKVHEWILEEKIKTAIIGIVKDGVEADTAMKIAIGAMKKVIGEIDPSVSCAPQKRGKWVKMQEPESPSSKFEVTCPFCEVNGFSDDSYCSCCGAYMEMEG